MNRLYWVRHGENRANITKEFSSRIVDYSLTSRGVLQAQQTGEYFRNVPIDAIFSSPLKRAVETAEAIAQPKRMTVQIMDAFREIDVGKMELLPPSMEAWNQHDQILKDWLTGKPETRFPGGDDYNLLFGRIRQGLETIFGEADGLSVVVVGHGGNLMVTLQDLCPGVDAWTVRRQVSNNCAISEFEFERQNGHLFGRLIHWASTAHLSGEALNFAHPIARKEDFVPRAGLAESA